MPNLFRLLALSFFVTLMLTGCGNKREINDLVIAVGMGVDKVEEGYLVSVQVVDPGEIAAMKGSGRTPVTVYKETGKTIFDAIRKMTSTAARKIYFSHLRMFLIGEETARTNGIGDAIEFLSRDHEVREDYYIAIAKKVTAEEILQALTPIEKIPANKMFTSLEMSNKSWAATGTVKIDELLTDLMMEGKAPVITGMRFAGDKSKAGKQSNVQITEPYARLKYAGMAVFRKDKLIGWLGEDESKGYNYIIGNVKSSVGTGTCPKDDGKYSIEFMKLKSRIQVKWSEHIPKVIIHIDVEGNVGEVQCPIDLTDPATIHQLEEDIQIRMDGLIMKTWNKAVSLNNDFVGLGAAIHRSKPREWTKLKEDWPVRMASLSVSTDVNVKLLGTGKTKGTFLEKMKE